MGAGRRPLRGRRRRHGGGPARRRCVARSPGQLRGDPVADPARSGRRERRSGRGPGRRTVRHRRGPVGGGVSARRQPCGDLDGPARRWHHRVSAAGGGLRGRGRGGNGCGAGRGGRRSGPGGGRRPGANPDPTRGAGRRGRGGRRRSRVARPPRRAEQDADRSCAPTPGLSALSGRGRCGTGYPGVTAVRGHVPARRL